MAEERNRIRFLSNRPTSPVPDTPGFFFLFWGGLILKEDL